MAVALGGPAERHSVDFFLEFSGFSEFSEFPGILCRHRLAFGNGRPVMPSQAQSSSLLIDLRTLDELRRIDDCGRLFLFIAPRSANLLHGSRCVDLDESGAAGLSCWFGLLGISCCLGFREVTERIPQD